MTILVYTDIARNIAQKLHIDNIIKDFYMGYDYNGDKTKAIIHTHNGKRISLSSFHNTMSANESIIYTVHNTNNNSIDPLVSGVINVTSNEEEMISHIIPIIKQQ